MQGEGVTFGARGLGARILGVREFSTAGYARIVFILNRETFDFKSGVLKKPTRIFLISLAGESGGAFKFRYFLLEKASYLASGSANRGRTTYAS